VSGGKARGGLGASHRGVKLPVQRGIEADGSEQRWQPKFLDGIAFGAWRKGVGGGN
jgi:hypothetical protein